MGKAGGLKLAAQAQAELLALHAAQPTLELRRVHWRRALGSAPVESLDAIARQFRLTSGAIYRVAALADRHARLAGRAAICLGDVRQAAATLNRQALDTLAAPLAPVGDWSELVAADETLRELLTLESRCRHRELLPAHVSPALAGQMTTGVRALFSGPSGTGKTLAARILASVLKMDLYRLDLSSVVNKYIGETEKNLEALFSRVEELDVMLLIDEGDALLTQRTNVQSANDRYANLETNFLLQRLESFGGIVIITTNAGDRIDGAFQRRMDVVVEFHAPEAAERWAIWQLHLPAGHRVDDGLLREAAARCLLTGGQIRNIVLHASVLALEEGNLEEGSLEANSVVTSCHLREAVQREYRKLGAVCPLRRTTVSLPVYAVRQGES
jgi:DNA polymerase III delta prime subunit